MMKRLCSLTNDSSEAQAHIPKSKTWNGDSNISEDAMTEFSTLLLLDKALMLSPEAKKLKQYPSEQLEQIKESLAKVMMYCESLHGSNQKLFSLRVIQFMVYQRAVKGVGQRSRLGFSFLFTQLYPRFPQTCMSLLDLVVSKYGSFADVNCLSSWFAQNNDTEGMKKLAKFCAKHVQSDLQKLLDPADPLALSHGELLDELKKCIDSPKPNVSVSLIGKWLPRRGHCFESFRFYVMDALWNTNFSQEKAQNSKKLCFFEKLYRVVCSCLNKHLKTVETLMCSKNFSSIVPAHVPAVALTKMRKAFLNELVEEPVPSHMFETGNRHPDDLDRVTCRQNFKMCVEKGEVKGSAQDVQSLSKLIFNRRQQSELEQQLINSQWQAIRTELDELIAETENGRHVLPVIDVSGSMECCNVIDIAIGLGVLCSQLSTIPNHFITFHESPSVVKLDPSADIFSVFNSVRAAKWGGSTNMDGTCDLVLELLTSNNIPNDYVFTIMILTDGQFNQMINDNSTFYDRMKRKFEAAGYPLPRIVFWNLNSSSPGFPVHGKQEGVQMVSGYSQTLLQQVLSQDFTLETVQSLTPEQTLRDALESFLDVEECVLKVGGRYF
ncbi:hypothetical protein GEMRC1_000818 [Eukaryota sp. GEM-RC1]